jgi:hypothetical protein
MATPSIVSCPSMPTFLHSSLIVGATCPICQQVYSPSEQPQGLSVTQSQYIPTTTGPAQPFGQTIGSASGYRTLKPPSSTASLGATSSLKDTLFAVRIAYASYIPNKNPEMPPHIHWECFNPDWIARIPSTVPLTYWSFTTNLLRQGEAQHLGYITRLCYPVIEGKWIVSTNHLETKNPVPRIWSQWDDKILIGEALTGVDYPPVSKKITERHPYPVTMLWYPDQDPETLPRQRERSINTITTDELLEPDPEALKLYQSIQASRTPQALMEPSEATPVPAKPVTNTLKRQLEDEQAQDEQAQPQGQALGEPQESRKSGRALKPRLRN